jgi:hypothetical protein
MYIHRRTALRADVPRMIARAISDGSVFPDDGVRCSPGGSIAIGQDACSFPTWKYIGGAATVAKLDIIRLP